MGGRRAPAEVRVVEAWAWSGEDLALRALDLFCCAGGASAGLVRAGFEVQGVDCEDQPEYPFAFTRGDALGLDLDYLRSFDLIWASPPCQGFTAYKRRPDHVAPKANLIPAVRELLRIAGVPYIIENVVGAPLESPRRICGSMFGLDVQRHRLFETSFPLPRMVCNHDVWTPRFPGATNRAPNSRKTVEVGVYRIPLATQREAMGIDWMSLPKLSQAIPPPYAEWLGLQARAHIMTLKKAVAA